MDNTSTSNSAPPSPIATNSSKKSTPESKKKKGVKDSENATRQRLFASTWDISDVLLDEGCIVSIKGVNASLLLLTHLKEFAKNIAIRGYSSMSKADLVLTIIQKHLMKDAYEGIQMEQRVWRRRGINQKKMLDCSPSSRMVRCSELSMLSCQTMGKGITSNHNNPMIVMH